MRILISLVLHAAIAALVVLALPRRSPDPVHVKIELLPRAREPLQIVVAPLPPRTTTPTILPVALRTIAPAGPAKPMPPRRAGPKPAPSVVADLAHEGEPVTPNGTGSAAAGSGEGGTGDGDGGGGGGNGGGSMRKPTPPKPIGNHSTRLPYTREAIESRVTGNVLIAVSIDATGNVVGTGLVKGLGHGLDPIALDLAKQLRFLPARDERDRPVAARITWRFHFAPPGSQP